MYTGMCNTHIHIYVYINNTFVVFSHARSVALGMVM